MSADPQRGNITTRISAKLRRELGAAAKEHGQSVSAEIEDRLEQSLLLEPLQSIAWAYSRMLNRYIELQIAKLEIRPGDTVVVSVPERLSVNQVEELRQRLAEQIGRDKQILLLTWGLTLASLSPAEIAAQARTADAEAAE
jgi:hypothetical protein